MTYGKVGELEFVFQSNSSGDTSKATFIIVSELAESHWKYSTHPAPITAICISCFLWDMEVETRSQHDVQGV
jgi:hypothetical protein